MISNRSLIMIKRVSALALVICLAHSPVLVAGQSNPAQSTGDAQPTASQETVRHKANDNESDDAGFTNHKRKDKKKPKHNEKPAPSKEEQEFEKVLQGIYG